jgi:dolichol-phosphate mannosyltransferase
MPKLTIVIPTYNEADNVAPLVESLQSALGDSDWEAIFVDDDSPDGTFRQVQKAGAANPKVRGLLRIGRRGLSSACIEGMLAANSDYLAVMDADHQHDESLLPAMLDQLQNGQADVVVASRYTGGGSSEQGLGHIRSAGSRLATYLSRVLLRQPLTDPMSGFFMMHRRVLDGAVKSLYGKGFKILLDILSAHEGKLRLVELPYDMKPRHAGESKLDTMVVLDFLQMLLNQKSGGLIPVRFLMFVMVGLTGVGVHMIVLYTLLTLLGSTFVWSQAMATFVAMTSNFLLNNWFTFRDRKLRGSSIVTGLLSFYLACSLGALINVAFASMLFDRGAPWGVAGVAGAVVGAVWNFALSSYLTWRQDVA